jgi:hypothetical protein
MPETEMPASATRTEIIEQPKGSTLMGSIQALIQKLFIARGRQKIYDELVGKSLDNMGRHISPVDDAFPNLAKLADSLARKALSFRGTMEEENVKETGQAIAEVFTHKDEVESLLVKGVEQIVSARLDAVIDGLQNEMRSLFTKDFETRLNVQISEIVQNEVLPELKKSLTAEIKKLKKTEGKDDN